MQLTAPAQALSSSTFWVGIAELYDLNDNARPRTLTGAAVLLRRALAAIGDPGRLEGRLVGAALGVVAAGKRATGVVT